MATQFYRFYGKAKWAKVHKPDEKYQRFTIDLFMDKKSWALYRKSGMQLKVRTGEMDDLEQKFVTFACPVSRIIKGEKQDFQVKVLNAKDERITDLVGNGSEVEVEVAVYDTVKGKGHRLVSVKVNKLVEFSKIVDAHEDDFEEEGDVPVEKKSKTSTKGDLDDEIPF